MRIFANEGNQPLINNHKNVMQLLTELTKGLETIEPFLKEYGFEFDNYQIDNGLNKHYTIATFSNERKVIHFDYRFAIGQVLYQFDDSIVSHPFYLDQLGFADRIHHKGFLLENKIESFKNILKDFEYLVDDFFEGECNKLKEIAKLQDTIISEREWKIRKENSIRYDNIRIEKARQVFRNKEFKKCQDIYNAVVNKKLLLELDSKIIAFSKRHVMD
jgi:hypothetical protein